MFCVGAQQAKASAAIRAAYAHGHLHAFYDFRGGQFHCGMLPTVEDAVLVDRVETERRIGSAPKWRPARRMYR